MDTPGALLNEQFLDKYDTPDGKIKIAGYGADFIKDRIREEGFIGQVLTEKPVTRQDLQVSVNHEGLVKIVQTEMAQRASTMSFRGQPDVVYIYAPRYEVPFYRIGSPRYEKTEIELMSYDIPLTDMVMKNIANDLEEIQDRQGLVLFETAVESAQKNANGVAFTASFSDTKAFTAGNIAAKNVKEVGKCKSIDVINNTAAGGGTASLNEDLIFPVQKDDIIKLKKLFIGTGGKGSRLRAEKALWSDADFEDINSWTLSDTGEKIVGETTVEGYKYKTVVGLRHFRTLKTDILRPGNIWAFAPEEYLGGFYSLNKLKFYTDKERDKFSFEGWKDIAMHLGNVHAVRKIELYAGSSDINTSTDNSAYASNYQPVLEENLGILNNLVAEGQSFPQVTNF